VAKWLTPRMLKAECEQAIKDGFGDMRIEVYPGDDDNDCVHEDIDFDRPTAVTDLVWVTEDEDEKASFITLYFVPLTEDEMEALEPL
jgi:hypothetical protein